MKSSTQQVHSQVSLVLMQAGNPVTTTVAISEGTCNEHASVIRLVRSYLPDLEEFGRVRFEIQTFDVAGGTQQREIAMLNEQQSTLLLTYMRNNDHIRGFKKKLVKAFYELHNRNNQTDTVSVLNDAATMRSLLLGYTERVMVLEGRLATLAPKAEALDRIATATDGSMCIRDAAKTLQIQESRLFTFLLREKWLYQRPFGTGKLAYSDKLKAGLMEHKVTHGMSPDGNEWFNTQARITAKGLTLLSIILGGGQRQHECIAINA